MQTNACTIQDGSSKTDSRFALSPLTVEGKDPIFISVVFRHHNRSFYIFVYLRDANECTRMLRKRLSTGEKLESTFDRRNLLYELNK